MKLFENMNLSKANVTQYSYIQVDCCSIVSSHHYNGNEENMNIGKLS